MYARAHPGTTAAAPPRTCSLLRRLADVWNALFGVLLIATQLDLLRVVTQRFAFLSGWFGRGMFLLYLGTVVMDPDAEVQTAVFSFFVGIFAIGAAPSSDAQRAAATRAEGAHAACRVRLRFRLSHQLRRGRCRADARLSLRGRGGVGARARRQACRSPNPVGPKSHLSPLPTSSDLVVRRAGRWQASPHAQV